jgi:serine/threonine protein phosphatase PrpC
VLRITGNKNGKVYLLCTDGVAEFDLTTQRFKTLLQGNVDAIYFNEKLYIGKREEVFVYNEVPETSISTISSRKDITLSASTWTKEYCGWEYH